MYLDELLCGSFSLSCLEELVCGCVILFVPNAQKVFTSSSTGTIAWDCQRFDQCTALTIRIDAAMFLSAAKQHLGPA